VHRIFIRFISRVENLVILAPELNIAKTQFQKFSDQWLAISKANKIAFQSKVDHLRMCI